ncbi:MAG: phosphonate ABC transporter, permease protein PhnE, partial [Paracoccaceae bacterium]
MSTLTPELRHFVNANIRRKRLMALAMPAVIVVYLIYVFFAFDVPGLAQKASLDKAKLLVSDSYSYKTHVLRDNRSGDVSVTVEGEAKGRFAQEDEPSWVVRDQGDVRIELGDDHFVVIGQEAVSFDIPDYGQIIAVPSR